MNTSRLESKTVRPGSLGTYSYYYRSARQPDPPSRSTSYVSSGGLHKLIPAKVVVTLVVIAALIGLPLLFGGGSGNGEDSKSSQATVPAASAIAASDQAKNYCAGNSQDKLLLVSISQRHMWACEQHKTVHDAPVITGMSAYAATVTPTGTYHIYGKQKDTILTGSDDAGSWRDPVSYWMPFLDNQHGTYGFHDATWRPDNEFGNVSPTASNASHGCVELPLSDAAWIYAWAPTGTTVTVQ